MKSSLSLVFVIVIGLALLTTLVLPAECQMDHYEEGGQRTGFIQAVQGWQAMIGNRYHDLIDFPPLPKCYTNIMNYLEGRVGAGAKHQNALIRRARADVIEMESLNDNSTQALQILETVRLQEITAINAADNFITSIETTSARLMMDCYGEAKEYSDYYKNNRGILKGRKPTTTSEMGTLDQIMVHPLTVRFRVYVVLHAQVFITSTIVMIERFVTTQLTNPSSSWRYLGNFMERCIHRAETTIKAANEQWDASMLSISALSDNTGVIDMAVKIWGAYGHVLQLYAVTVAYAVAPFFVLVFLIVTATIMAPVVVWYHIGYGLLWLVWVKKFLWQSMIVPEIASRTTDGARLGPWDVYGIAEVLMTTDKHGDGGAVAAVPIAILVVCAGAIVVITATSLVLTALDLAGERWEIVEGRWSEALDRLDAAQAEDHTTAAKK